MKKIEESKTRRMEIGKSCKISEKKKSINKKEKWERSKRKDDIYKGKELIKRIKNCKDDDNIFDFIDDSTYKKYILRIQHEDVTKKKEKNDHLKNGSIEKEKVCQHVEAPFIYFESVNAYELKKFSGSDKVFTLLFEMTKINMERLYNDSNFLNKGWSDDKKWKELQSDKCKLILGFLQHTNEENEYTFDEKKDHPSDPTNNGEKKKDRLSFLQIIKQNDKNKNDLEIYLSKHKLVCFVHYRLTADYPPYENTTVCYLYEIQIAPAYTKRGIGKHLIDMLKALCTRINIPKILCTVLKKNFNAVLFYKNKCSFEIDQSSPDNFASDDSEECEYEILKLDVYKHPMKDGN
ncbi:N-acetyltransferase [Plasmodium gonderi]|uniref:N-alpha-acetyltransferase 40 n=1 Tax=Plasmodium gonderi TaxID=77519 RepID=A0A1Y1JJC1_PLAGO|nr:N-acetyltransferase [Plasmodium gonderi]GAW82330.1 N-acetyltransferase [Plasmodium gonderi]